MLSILNGSFKLSDTRVLSLIDLTINNGQSWAFIGANGSGKSALARALAGDLTQLSGTRQTDFTRIARISFEQLQKLVNDEWTDIVGADEDDSGKTAGEVVQEQYKNSALCEKLARQFGIDYLLDRRFKYLSTGETRKVMLCQALMSNPELLILDEPFDGLDIESRQQFSLLLAELVTQGITLVLVINRFDDIPDFINNVGVLSECKLTCIGERHAILTDNLIKQLCQTEKLSQLKLPEPDESPASLMLDNDLPRVILRNGYVHYNDRPILNNLTWQVNVGEHWQITGPNGAGKSTLLSLITGDHAQGYSNDLWLFGRKRGSGETIWDIKCHIGYVSSSLHLDYRVSASLRNVILSGYFDSIGVYQAVSDRQKKLTEQWIEMLGLTAQIDLPFQSLSWGQQRLVLIARACVKHPTLLILDEPLQGLDQLNRELVKRWIDILINEGNTQLLFVSHHQEDAPNCITHKLSFIPNQNEINFYHYKQQKVKP